METGTTENQTVLVVPAATIGDVKTKLEKLAKRATKLGLAAPTWNIGEKVTKKVKGRMGGMVEHVTYPVTVNHGKVQIPGWVFLGSIEPGKSGNMVYPVPGIEMPEKFRHTDCECDHCHINRDRKNLYAFRHEDGRLVQVGSKCLHDYMGIDPVAIAYWAGLEKALHEVEEEGWGGRSGYYISLVEFTTAVAAVIEHEGGFISMSKAGEGQTATAWLASTVLWPGRDDKAKAYSRKVWALVTPELIAQVEEAVRFIRDDWKANNDFAWNLKTIVNAGAITSPKQFGIGAALYPTYLREVGRLKEIEAKRKVEAAKAANSVHLGKEGERLRNLKATVTMASFIRAGDFGDTYLYKFLTEDGNILVWFTGPNGLKAGEKVTITGTVKAHNTYKDVQETQITRAKFGVTKKLNEE